MTEDHLRAIEFEIKNGLYYVEYPTDIGYGIWKDGLGKINFMEDMGLDHLKASIKKVENDLVRLNKSRREPEVIEALAPLVNQKLQELKRAFASKTNA